MTAILSPMRRYWVILTTQLLIVSALIAYCFGPIWDAQWGFIDDHNIFLVIGKGHRLHPSRFLEQLKATEVFRFGEYPRYRPTYYVFQLLESMMWGKNPQLWYGFRLCSTIGSLLVLWRILQKYFGIVVSGLLVVYFLSFRFWDDAVLRLGPGEFYAIFGLAMFAWGVDNLFRGGATACRSVLSLSTFFIGGLVCIGVKENLVLISGISVWLLIYALQHGRASRTLIAATIAHVVYSAIVVVSIFLATRASGQDIYSRDVSFKARSMLLHSLLTQGDFILVALITVAIWGVFIGAWIGQRRLKGSLGLLSISAGFCLAFYGANFVFYNGKWPTGMRYDYPAIFIKSIALMLLVRLLQLLWPTFGSFTTLRIRYIIVAILLLYVSISTPAALGLHRIVAQGNKVMTGEMTGRIAQIARRLRAHPSHPVVITSSNISADYEFIFSYQRFLRGYGVSNPISVECTAVPQAPGSSGEKLQQEIIAISKNGNENFLPLAPEYPTCFLLKLSGESRFACKVL